MTRREREDTQMWLTLLGVALIVAACLAWMVPAVERLALNLTPSGGARTAGIEPRCSNCGVIANVRETRSATSRHEGAAHTGGRAGIVMIILGAIGGNFHIGPGKIYQVEVRMQDGSVRSIQSATAPAHKPGDRVKVVGGRIEQIS